MDDDFALIDFALVPAPALEVAQALGVALSRDAGPARPDPAPKKGLLGRLLGRGPAPRATGPLLIQPRSSLGPEPLTRLVLDDMGAGAAERLIRISGPVGAGGLTLVEFREGDGESSPLCMALSAALRDREVFYFRVSGERHPGAHHAFHVYQNGLASRRAVSVSFAGTHPEAPWDGVDAGIFHPLETDTMGPPQTRRSEIMTVGRQASILEALGVDPDTLFEGTTERPAVLVLSPAPGGLPLSEAAVHLGPRLRGPATFAPTPPTVPEREGPTEAARADRADSQAHAAPPQEPAPSWDEEVTGLLVAAVEAALPEEEQVPWLGRLTQLLEEGEVETALDEARALIDSIDAPESDRDAIARRLEQLFTPADAPGR